MRLSERLMRLACHSGQAAAIRRARPLRKALQATRQIGGGDRIVCGIACQLLSLRYELFLDGGTRQGGMRSQGGLVLAAPHDRIQ